MIFFLIAINAVNLIKGKKNPTGTKPAKNPQSGSDICLYSLPM